MNRPYYSRRQLTRLLHLTPRQLARWEKRGLLPRQQRYGWLDLIRARALRQLEAAAIRPAAVARSLASARQRLPELDDSLSSARLGMFAGRVELRCQGVYMDALSGQLRFGFEQADAGRAMPSPDPPPTAHQQRRQEAEQWFAFGLSLEGEAELREQAAAAYTRCLDLESTFVSAHINLGTLRYHQRDFASAERCYRNALALDPNYALAHFNLGNVLDETGRLDLAVTAYAEAVRLVPNYADAHYNLALAYQRLGQPRRAVPHWRIYLGLDKQSAWATHARTQLRQALAHDPLQVVARAR
jgi:tetratricopeptide (TPR) repeat protein